MQYILFNIYYMARTLKRKRTRRHKRKRHNNVTVKKGGKLFNFNFGKKKDVRNMFEGMFDKEKNMKDNRSENQIEREYDKFGADGDRDSMMTQRYIPDVTKNLHDTIPGLQEAINAAGEEKAFQISQGIKPDDNYLGQVAAEAYEDSKKTPQKNIKIQEYADKVKDTTEQSKDTSVRFAIVGAIVSVVVVGGITVLTEYIINSKHAHTS